MTTEQRGKLWSMIRDNLAFAVTVCELHPYEMMSAKLDSTARGLADNIEEMVHADGDKPVTEEVLTELLGHASPGYGWKLSNDLSVWNSSKGFGVYFTGGEGDTDPTRLFSLTTTKDLRDVCRLVGTTTTEAGVKYTFAGCGNFEPYDPLRHSHLDVVHTVSRCGATGVTRTSGDRVSQEQWMVRVDGDGEQPK